MPLLVFVVLFMFSFYGTTGDYVLGWTDAGGEHSTQKVPKVVPLMNLAPVFLWKTTDPAGSTKTNEISFVEHPTALTTTLTWASSVKEYGIELLADPLVKVNVYRVTPAITNPSTVPSQPSP